MVNMYLSRNTYSVGQLFERILLQEGVLGARPRITHIIYSHIQPARPLISHLSLTTTLAPHAHASRLALISHNDPPPPSPPLTPDRHELATNRIETPQHLETTDQR